MKDFVGEDAQVESLSRESNRRRALRELVDERVR